MIPIIDTTNSHNSSLIALLDAPQLAAIEKSFYEKLFVSTLLLAALFGMLYFWLLSKQKAGAVQKRLVTVAKTMGEGLYIQDNNGKIEYINDSAKTMLGYDEGELVGKEPHRLFHENISGEMDTPEDCKIYRELMSNKKFTGALKFIKKDGSVFVADVIASPLEVGGKLIGSITVFRDITERVTLEESLRELNAKLEQRVEQELQKRVNTEKAFGMVFEKNPEGMLILDRDGVVLECNGAAHNMLSYKKEALIGKSITELSPNIQPEYELFSEDAMRLFLDNASNGETQTFEWTLTAMDGREKTAEVVLSRMDWQWQSALLCTWRDVTQLKMLETQKREAQTLLIQQHKLAEMGAMIGAIAHQWKQPLNALWLMIQETEMAYEYGDLTGKDMQKFRENAKTQVDFMNQTIENFRNFYKPSLEASPFLLDSAIKSVIGILQRQLQKGGIVLLMECDEGLTVYGYENEFKQVILNIINNAKDALQSNTQISNKKVRISARKKEGQISIEIEDNAGGINEEMLKNQKLFDSYSSTKGSEGTGIGLSLSKTIIEKKMNGKIEASNTKEGARFCITLGEYRE